MSAELATATVIEFPTKVCNGCGVAKPHAEFYTKSNGKGGRRLKHLCKPCANKREHELRGTKNPFFRMDDVRKLDASGDLAEKRCPTCETWKTPGKFYKNTANTHGIGFQCRECTDKVHHENMRKDKDFMRNKNMLHQYGITLDDARVMLAHQHGLCANRACGKEILIDTKCGNKQKAFVDHCHVTGAVRGILCISCNTALGLLEQKNKMLGLTEYLENNQSKQGVIRHGN